MTREPRASISPSPLAKVFKDQHNTDVRVLPAGNDVARLSPIRTGRAQVSAMGVGVYFAQEAVFEFATADWGPQALQVLLSSVDCNGTNLGIAKDTGVTEIKGLKGKRVGFVVGRTFAQPECARHARLRRAHAQRRDHRRVLELRRHVEGHGEQ